jgi:hypothetical protein
MITALASDHHYDFYLPCQASAGFRLCLDKTNNEVVFLAKAVD